MVMPEKWRHFRVSGGFDHRQRGRFPGDVVDHRVDLRAGLGRRMTQLLLENFGQAERAGLGHAVRERVRDIILINAGRCGIIRELRGDDRFLRFTQDLAQHDRFKLAAGFGHLLLFRQMLVGRQLFHRDIAGVNFRDRKSTRLNSSHQCLSRMPSSA